MFNRKKIAKLQEDLAFYKLVYSTLVKRNFFRPVPMMIQERIAEIQLKLIKLGAEETKLFYTDNLKLMADV